MIRRSGGLVLAALAALAALGAACDGADTSVEYEPYSGTPPYPESRPALPAPRGYFGYVADHGSDSITVVDLPGHEVVARIPIGRDPVGIDGPRGLAMDSAGHLYTALSYPAPSPLPGPHALHAPSVRPGFVQKLAADDLRPLGEVQIDTEPGELAMSPDGSRLIVTHFDLARAFDPARSAEAQRSSLKVIDPSAILPTGSPPPRTVPLCRAAHGAAFAADGHSLVVACYADDSVVVVDTADLAAPQKVLPLGCRRPASVEASRSRASVAVSCVESREVRIVDTRSLTVVDAKLAAQGSPQASAWSRDESKLWVPTQSPDAVVVFDLAAQKATIQRVFDASTCLRPRQAKLGREGAVLYVVCEGDHVGAGTVLALDPTTLETKDSLPVGVFPHRLVSREVP